MRVDHELEVIISEAVDIVIRRIKAQKQLYTSDDGNAYRGMLKGVSDDFLHGGAIFGELYSAIYRGCGWVFMRYCAEMMLDTFYNKTSTLSIDYILKRAINGEYVLRDDFRAGVDEETRIVILSALVYDADVVLKRVTSYKKFLSDVVGQRVDKTHLYVKTLRNTTQLFLTDIVTFCYRYVVVPDGVCDDIPLLRRKCTDVRDGRFGIGLTKRK